MSNISLYNDAALLLGGVAIYLRWQAQWVRTTFGSPMSPPEELATHGPYRYIRHPAYAGYMLFVVAVAFATSWVVLIGLFFVVRIVTGWADEEERLLEERYGKEYEAYKNRTWRFVPFVY